MTRDERMERLNATAPELLMALKRLVSAVRDSGAGMSIRERFAVRNAERTILEAEEAK